MSQADAPMRLLWNAAVYAAMLLKCPGVHDITRFERSTDLNLFKYMFNVIQNWETDSLQFYTMVLIFC